MRKIDEQWAELNAMQRNELIGETLGMKPMTQCWIALAGQRIIATPHEETELAKAQAILDEYTRNDGRWKQFKAKFAGITDAMRAKLTVAVERWHIRYSDTPGGGWDVIEWIRAQGFVVSLIGVPGDAWKVLAASADTDTAAGFGAVAETMQEAACLMALRIKAANQISEPSTKTS